jgi:hypothetical protein
MWCSVFGNVQAFKVVEGNFHFFNKKMKLMDDGTTTFFLWRDYSCPYNTFIVWPNLCCSIPTLTLSSICWQDAELQLLDIVNYTQSIPYLRHFVTGRDLNVTCIFGSACSRLLVNLPYLLIAHCNLLQPMRSWSDLRLFYQLVRRLRPYWISPSLNLDFSLNYFFSQQTAVQNFIMRSWIARTCNLNLSKLPNFFENSQSFQTKRPYPILHCIHCPSAYFFISINPLPLGTWQSEQIVWLGPFEQTGMRKGNWAVAALLVLALGLMV